MMEEITLTGATMTSDGGEEHVELTQQAAHHSFHSHSHSHSHQSTGASCESSSSHACGANHNADGEPRMTVNMGELLKAAPGDQFKALATLIRMGSYQAFDQVLRGLLDDNRTVAQDVMNRVGDDGHSLLHWAAKRVDDVRFLTSLCQQVSPKTLDTPSNDDTAMYPLHWACTEGSIPHVATLLKHGAHLEAQDKSGCTPVLISAQYGQVNVVAYLLQQGAEGTATDKSNDSALHWAAYKGSIQVCGLLVFRKELSFTTPDAYGQTPLHLASLRGNTSVVRYILQESTPAEQRQLLHAQDKNHKTPLDLAIQKKRPTVQAVLRDAMERLEHSRRRDNVVRQLQSSLRQLCSLHSWKLWMGCQTLQDEEDESPKFPLYFVVATMTFGVLWYPFVFIPINTSKGILWDIMGWHLLCIVTIMAMWYSLYKTYTTDPGTLDDASPHTPALRRLYEQTLESYSDEESFTKNETPLCHTCHIARPLRSKHCRVARRCVLLFDHHCPFVGNTIGLHNYKWFYLCLLFMTLSLIGFLITWGIYVHRSPSVSWGILLGGIYLGFFILPAGGMCIYHTQLMIVNLTTNEHQNLGRYKYLQNERGQYKNPFFRGAVRNILDRFAPTEATYTLPTSTNHDDDDRLSLLHANRLDDIV